MLMSHMQQKSGGTLCHLRVYRKSLRGLLAPFALAVCALAGCGGGGSAASPPVQATVTPIVPAGTFPVSALPTSVPFSAGTIAGSVLFLGVASPPSGATVTLSASVAAPPGAPAIQSTLRHVSSSASAILFVQMSATQTLSMSGLPGFQFSLTGLDPTKGLFYIGFFDPAKSPAVWQQIEGPGIIGSGVLVFGPTTSAVTMSATLTYVFDLYQVGATPGTVAVAPSSLSFLGTSVADAQLVTVSEAGYTGAFTLRSSCASIAAINPSGNQYIVIPTAAGTCSAMFTDANGNNAILPIVVTVTTGGGQ